MLLFAGSATEKGNNDYNEDRFTLIKSIPEDPSSAFFAIYDGHGGDKASSYCAKHLHTHVVNHNAYATNKSIALTEGFKETDKAFLKKLEDSGSTANAILIDINNKKLYCANTGDSRSVLSCKKKATPLSEDHKPGNAAEKKRILAASHTVEREQVLVRGKRLPLDRVDGQVAVSRAIGDGDYKDLPDAPAENQAITCVPDVKEREITPKDEFLVLACDGLWDVMKNQDVVDYVYKLLYKESKEPVSDGRLITIAQQLVNYAIKEKESPDNVTAVIVAFQHPPSK
jgi:protein phosphatase 2C family protein 2/3